jgi:hypothetical protein
MCYFGPKIKGKVHGEKEKPAKGFGGGLYRGCLKSR